MITCTAYGPAGPAVFLATTEDFRVGRADSGSSSPPRTRTLRSSPSGSAGNGSSSTGRRRASPRREPGIALSRSTDLRSWSAPEVVMQPRRGAWWDSLRIGIGPPLLKTEHGWLLVYHGVKETVAGAIYRVGLALLDLEEPTRVLRRTRRLGACAPRGVRARGRCPQRALPVRHDPRHAPPASCASTTAPPTRRSASRPQSSTTCSTPCSARRPSTRVTGSQSSARSRGGRRRATTGRGSASPG